MGQAGNGVQEGIPKEGTKVLQGSVMVCIRSSVMTRVPGATTMEVCTFYPLLHVASYLPSLLF
jgi:hypothetical protein